MTKFVLLRYAPTGRVQASTLMLMDEADAIRHASSCVDDGPVELWLCGQLVWRSGGA